MHGAHVFARRKYGIMRHSKFLLTNPLRSRQALQRVRLCHPLCAACVSAIFPAPHDDTADDAAQHFSGTWPALVRAAGRAASSASVRSCSCAAAGGLGVVDWVDSFSLGILPVEVNWAQATRLPIARAPLPSCVGIRRGPCARPTTCGRRAAPRAFQFDTSG